MKIVCDFLPTEYKAVRRNLKLVFATIGTWAITIIILMGTTYSYRSKLEDVKKRYVSANSAVANLEGKIASVRYPQDKIRRLIQKFRFIQQAMGSVDYPYLEFFQALEKAVPINEDTGLRKISIKKLKRGVGDTWHLSGVATHWDDILRFEDNLNESVFEKPIEGTDKTTKKQNFRGVRILTVNRRDKGGVTFEMEFQFNVG